MATCVKGFVERSDHFQFPEFQTWESEGTLPDIDLFPDEFCKYAILFRDEKHRPILGGKKFCDETVCTELYKEIDWMTGFLPANSGQSGLTLQLKQLFQL